MRLLIVATLKGQLTSATKIAMDKGASVTHAESNAQAWRCCTGARAPTCSWSMSRSMSATSCCASRPNTSTCRSSPAERRPMPAPPSWRSMLAPRNTSRCPPTRTRLQPCSPRSPTTRARWSIGTTPWREVVATSNRKFGEAVREGTFRQDLLFRLNVMNLESPPPRERPGDVLELVQHSANGVPPRPLSAEAKRQLMTARWPGNVRDLE